MFQIWILSGKLYETACSSEYWQANIKIVHREELASDKDKNWASKEEIVDSLRSRSWKHDGHEK